MALRDLAGDRVRVLAGRYLAPYVHEREPAAASGPVPEGSADLEVPLETVDAAPVGR